MSAVLNLAKAIALSHISDEDVSNLVVAITLSNGETGFRPKLKPNRINSRSTWSTFALADYVFSCTMKQKCNVTTVSIFYPYFRAITTKLQVVYHNILSLDCSEAL